MELNIQRFHDDYDEDTRHDPHDGGTDGVHRRTARRDTDETCQTSVDTHGHVGFAVLNPSENHRHAGRHRRGNRRIHEDGGKLRRSGCRRAVKAVPTEPKNKRAERTQGNGVTGNGVDFRHFAALIFGIFPDTGAQENCADEGGDTADHMDCRRACIVVETKSRKPAAAPNPMRFNGINEQGNDRGINAIGNKFRSFRHRARNDGRRRRAEHEVEHEGRRSREPFRRAFDKPYEIRPKIHVGDPDEAEEGVLAHHQPKPEQGEYDRADAEIHQVFHDNVACVFRSRKSRFHHGKACLHEENQRRTDQVPKFNRHNYTSLFSYSLSFPRIKTL